MKRHQHFRDWSCVNRAFDSFDRDLPFMNKLVNCMSKGLRLAWLSADSFYVWQWQFQILFSAKQNYVPQREKKNLIIQLFDKICLRAKVKEIFCICKGNGGYVFFSLITIVFSSTFVITVSKLVWKTWQLCHAGCTCIQTYNYKIIELLQAPNKWSLFL